jgi:CRISPR/Cas system-associated exonuclease Cas4 (RecB family)
VAEARTLGWNEAETAEARDKVTYGAWRMVELYEEEFGLGDKQAEREGQILSEMHLFKFYKGWCLEGYIDVAVQPDREVHTLPEKLEAVYDVKTGTSHEQGQLQFYDVLVEAYFGMRPKRLCWIEPLARGVVEVMVTPEENFAMKQRIKAAVESIQANEFPTSGFPKKCGWCSSSPFCPATERARNMKLV